MPRVISEAKDATLMLRRPYPRMARPRRRALTTSVVHYHRRLHCRGKAWRRKGFRDGSYHHIYCTPPNPLVAFMWRRPLNSTIWVAVTHGRFGEMSNSTSTRVVAYVINKWRAKINRKRLYNVRSPPKEREDLRIGRENTIAW